MGCSFSHLLSTSCLRFQPLSQTLFAWGLLSLQKHPLLRVWGITQILCGQNGSHRPCPLNAPLPHQHVRSTAAPSLHLALQLSASVSTWGVQFLSVGTRGRERSGKLTNVSVANQKWQRMGGQARLKEAKLRKAGRANKQRKRLIGASQRGPEGWDQA